MADNIDIAQELNELSLEAALTKMNKRIPVFTGKCRNCGTKISKGTFCGRDCRDEFE